MIVFTTTLILIIAAVVARAGVATSGGSIHSLGDHFALSGHQRSSASAGKLFLCGFVVRIAGLLRLSMLLSASTYAPGLPGIVAGPLDRDRLAGEPIERSASRHRAARATPRTPPWQRGNITIMSGSVARTGSAGVQILAGRPFAGVLHRVSGPVITMPGRTRGVITGNSASTGVPAVVRNLRAGSVNAGRRDAKRTALDRSGVPRDAPARRKDDDCSPPDTSAPCTGSGRRGIG